MTRLISILAFLLGLGFAASALAQSNDYTGSIGTLARKPPDGKLATQTEIVAGESQAALLSPSSPEAMDAAIAMYEHITAAGGWPTVSERGLEKGTVGRQVVFLRQRLVAEGYLPPESLDVDLPEKFSAELREAVKAFQSNHGLATTGKIDDRTLAELNVPAGVRLQELRINRPRVATYAAKLGPRYILVIFPRPSSRR